MSKVTFAVKIQENVLGKLKEFCTAHGTKYSFFVEKAIKEKLEEEALKEDLLDFRRLQDQESQAISFEEYLDQRDV